MPQDPHAHFDPTVLDLIEHSPTGVVPATPSYMDALKRLLVTHQVYASANHKGGYVTSRSLATAAVFHAQNLADVVAGRAEPAALENNFSIFERYVASLPVSLRERAAERRAAVAGKASQHRAKHVGEHVVLAHDPIHTLFLVPGTGPHPGLPGNYLFGSALQHHAESNSTWAIHLHDSDDGLAICELPTMSAAWEKLQEVLVSAPFNMNELASLGFILK